MLAEEQGRQHLHKSKAATLSAPDPESCALCMCWRMFNKARKHRVFSLSAHTFQSMQHVTTAVNYFSTNVERKIEHCTHLPASSIHYALISEHFDLFHVYALTYRPQKRENMLM